jgi:hypothetical protein
MRLTTGYSFSAAGATGAAGASGIGNLGAVHATSNTVRPKAATHMKVCEVHMLDPLVMGRSTAWIGLLVSNKITNITNISCLP